MKTLEQKAAYMRGWRNKDLQHYNKYQKRYRDSHKDAMNASQRRRRAEHPERFAVYKRTSKTRYNVLKSHCKKVSREFNLTFEQWFEISLKPCHWCGGTLPEVGHGMDRLDNEQGYSVENCVPSCATCNRNRNGHEGPL